MCHIRARRGAIPPGYVMARHSPTCHIKVLGGVIPPGYGIEGHSGGLYHPHVPQGNLEVLYHLTVMKEH